MRLCSLHMSLTVATKNAGLVAERLRVLFLLKSLDHLTAVCGVGTNPALATCETSQILLADVPDVFFFSGFSRFRPPTDWSISYELK